MANQKDRQNEDSFWNNLEAYGFKDNEAVKLQLQKPKERITKFAPQIVKDAKEGFCSLIECKSGNWYLIYDEKSKM